MSAIESPLLKFEHATIVKDIHVTLTLEGARALATRAENLAALLNSRLRATFGSENVGPEAAPAQN